MKNKITAFEIKSNWFGTARLFFYILNNPGEILRLLKELGNEMGKLEEELATLKMKLAEEMSENVDLKLEIRRLKKL
jgi:phage-related holin